MNKSILRPLLFILFGIGMGIFLSSVYIGNSDEFISKTKHIDRLHEVSVKMESLIDINKKLAERVASSDTVIIELRESIDSLDNLIVISSSELEKIKEEYEKIGNVDNWDVNERIRFFTEYFRRKSTSEGSK